METHQLYNTVLGSHDCIAAISYNRSKFKISLSIICKQLKINLNDSYKV